MLEASSFSPSAKQTLSTHHYRSAVAQAHDLEDELVDRSLNVAAKGVAEVVEIWGRALQAAPDHDRWRRAWDRFCFWQATLDTYIEFCLRRLGPADSTMRLTFLRVYDPDPDVPQSWWSTADDKLAELGLFAPLEARRRDRVRETWQTALGRAVMTALQCRDEGADA